MNADLCFDLQTQQFGSLEAFVAPAALDALNNRIDELVGRIDPTLIDTRRKRKSVHEVVGYSHEQVAQLYQPRGRIEITAIPEDVVSTLTQAVEKNLSKIRRVFPYARTVSEWLIVEYAEGQFVNAHIDLPFDDQPDARPKLGAVSIQLRTAEDGGEFFLQTCDPEGLWRPGLEQQTNYSSQWFVELAKSAWVCDAAAGTALLWGSRLIHGTRPVRSGTSRKAIAFMLC